MTKEYLSKIIDLVTAAFGLVAALAWNEAIQALINKYYSVGNDLTGRFLYAIIITAFAVWLTTSLTRIYDRLHKSDKK